MKRKILQLIKKSGGELIEYRCYRSDMGCQCFDVWFNHDGERKNLHDSYFVGCPGGREYIVTQIIELLNSTK